MSSSSFVHGNARVLQVGHGRNYEQSNNTPTSTGSRNRKNVIEHVAASK